MKIEKIAYGNWSDAWRLEHAGMEMIVVTEIGPRIMSFKLADGPNILFEDSRIGFQRGDWHLYGGHRFWIGPEAEHAFIPDNDPCEVEIAPDMLRVYQRPDYNGLQKIIEIGPSPQTGGFLIHHILRVTGTLIYPGAIWVLTCIQPGLVVAPWGAGSSIWRTNMVRYFPAWANHTTNVASSQWKPGNEVFQIEPTGEEGKVGLYSEEGFVANLRADSTFIKVYDPIIEGHYPDGGCNLEIYTCKHFVELETLSPLYTFNPGRDYTHSEHWLLTPQTFEPKDWRKIGELVFKD